MAKLSELSNRIVLSKIDCKKAGVIRDAFFDGNCKKIAYFLCSGEKGDFLLPYSDALSFGDAVIVENAVPFTCLEDADLTELCAVRRGMQVFSQDGTLKGAVDDVEFDAKGKVLKLTAGEFEFSPYDMYGVGDVILLRLQPMKKRGRKPKLSYPAENRPVFALDEFDTPHDDEDVVNDENSSPDGENTHNPESAADYDAIGEKGDVNRDARQSFSGARGVTANTSRGAESVPITLGDQIRGLELAASDHIPPRVIADYNFLLGRTLSENLFSYAGELLASKGETVTVKMVELIRRHGKLVELTLNSK